MYRVLCDDGPWIKWSHEDSKPECEEPEQSQDAAHLPPHDSDASIRSSWPSYEFQSRLYRIPGEDGPWIAGNHGTSTSSFEEILPSMDDDLLAPPDAGWDQGMIEDVATACPSLLTVPDGSDSQSSEVSSLVSATLY